MPDENDRKDAIEFLKSHGWGEERVDEFLESKVGMHALRIPAQFAADIISAVKDDAIPYGEVNVNFLVPESSWEAFKTKVETTIHSKGGFCLDESQDQLISPQSKEVN